MTPDTAPPSTLTQPGLPASAETARCTLLLFGNDTFREILLPRSGAFVIGRAGGVDLELPGPAVSRRHAQIVLSGDEAHLMDLSSHNGTLVDGERLEQPRVLLAGEVIIIGETRLVFCRSGGRSQRPLLDPEQLRLRLNEEIARLADAPHRVVTLLCADFLGPPPERAALLQALAAVLRPGEVMAWGEHALSLLLPDLVDVEVEDRVATLWAALSTLGLPLRGGFATCPLDGAHADAVEVGARGAARLASAGEVRAVASTATTLRVLDHQVLLVEPAMREIFELLRRYARSDLPVLLRGETGSGKELAAAAVHVFSARAAGPFLTQSCAALLDSQSDVALFGASKGTHPGVSADQPGLFEAASGGTLFFDEIGDLTLTAQAKLLRVLETRQVRRLGEMQEREVDARIVAATNRDLDAEVQAGRFRADLLFRLRVAQVHLPPLRQRPRELPLLARHFLVQACRRQGRAPLVLTSETMQWLQAQSWPGNVRELKNAMEHLAVGMPEGATLVQHWDLDHWLSSPGTTRFQPLAKELEELERTRIAQALAAGGGVYTRAAALLQIPVRTLYNKLRRHGLVTPGAVGSPGGDRGRAR